MTYYYGNETIQRIITKFADYIKQETLSKDLIQSKPETGAYTEEHKLDGFDLTLGVKR